MPLRGAKRRGNLLYRQDTFHRSRRFPRPFGTRNDVVFGSRVRLIRCGGGRSVGGGSKPPPYNRSPETMTVGGENGKKDPLG